jgi:hypothetical protein
MFAHSWEVLLIRGLCLNLGAEFNISLTTLLSVECTAQVTVVSLTLCSVIHHPYFVKPLSLQMETSVSLLNDYSFLYFCCYLHFSTICIERADVSRFIFRT